MAQRRHRELARMEKVRSKLSAIEQARLEVEKYENQLELLLSVHKEPCQEWDWVGLAAVLPAPIPKNYSDCEMRARQLALVTLPSAQHECKSVIEQARALDEQTFQEATAAHTSETAAMEAMRGLAITESCG